MSIESTGTQLTREHLIGAIVIAIVKMSRPELIEILKMLEPEGINAQEIQKYPKLTLLN